MDSRTSAPDVAAVLPWRPGGLPALIAVLAGSTLAAGVVASSAGADPAAGFTGPSAATVGDVVEFVADASCEAPVSCTWTVDGPDGRVLGPTASSKTLSFDADAAGTLSIALTVSDPDDPAEPSVSAPRGLVVAEAPPPPPPPNQAPEAVISAGGTAAVGEPVSFDSRLSTDPEAGLLTRTWFVDGVVVDGETGDILTRSFETPGERVISVRVTDPEGLSDETFTTVLVTSPPPQATILASALEPLTLEPVSFTAQLADPSRGPLVYAWDTDDDDEFDDGDSERVDDVRFDRPGRKRVRVRVGEGGDDERVSEIEVNVRNRAPRADFTWDPPAVKRRGQVTFTSQAVDTDGTVVAEAWDLDGDGGYDDAFGPVAVHSFTRGGAHEVGLRVTDDSGAVAQARLVVVAGNDTPRAGFDLSDATPAVGAEVVLTSTSSDTDGTIAAHEWDLDGDGAFDDAQGATARLRPVAAGALAVGLRVVDNDGSAAIALRELQVGPAAEPLKPPRALRLLAPFPTVRIAGQVTRRGASLRVVQVVAPRGATISWTCRGRGCRARRQTLAAGRVRVRRLQSTYRAGAKIEISVKRRNRIGKHTRITIRAGRAPARRDACLFPGRKRPRACPAA